MNLINLEWLLSYLDLLLSLNLYRQKNKELKSFFVSIFKLYNHNSLRIYQFVTNAENSALKPVGNVGGVSPFTTSPEIAK